MTEATGVVPQRNNFLVVVDQTPESRVALRFAARRAERVGGGVILLHVIEPSDTRQWIAVEDLMRQEAREDARQLLRSLAAEVRQMTGIMPALVVREGRTKDELLKLLAEDSSIRILVLGAAPGSEGPGPLVLALAGQLSGGFSVPITVVPGSLTLEQIDALT